MTSPNAAGTSGAKESTLTTLISRLERRNVPYFYKVMTKSAVTETVQGAFAYALEFPESFVRAQGTHFGVLANFQRPNPHRTWPIKVTVIEDPAPKHRVFAYGPGGWKAFVVDNVIEVGDILVFSLELFSYFVVDIIKAPPAEDHEEALVPCKRCRKVPAQDGPRFVVNVAPTEVNQLAVPISFWECFRDMLKSEELQLKGPNGAVMMVKVARAFHKERVLGVVESGLKREMGVLESGWTEFFVANDLRCK